MEARVKSCARDGDSIPSRRREADRFAKHCLDAMNRGTPITDHDVLQALRLWGFERNQSRQNVRPDNMNFVYSNTLGVIDNRRGRQGAMQRDTMHYPNFCRLLNCWLESNVRDMQLQPAHTTITINSAYAGKLHRDANNLGPSFVKAFGCCTGGALGYYQKDPGIRMDLKMVDSACGPPEILDLQSNLILMDGTKAHYVQPFEGERFSVVWFTCSRYVQGNEYLDKALREAGFPIDSKFHERSKKLQSMVVDQPAMKVST